MIRIVADDMIPFLRGVLEPYADVTYLPGKQIDREAISDADALLIRTRTKCTESLLRGTGIRFIGTATIGFDHIDTHFCDNQGIKWTNAPGCNSSSVMQYMAASLLKLSHESGFALKDKILGIIGAGNVGSKVEKFARALGMTLLLNDPPRARREGPGLFTDLKTVLHEPDIVTLHVPLNFVGEDFTYHLINEGTIKNMKNGVWFINTSRGEVAETSALIKAIDTGRLSGVILDVWENEPDIDKGLMRKAFIATPHIAGYSADGKANGTAMVVNALADFFSLPINKWYPQQIPGPQKPFIFLDGKDKNEESAIGEAIARTYDIAEDDKNLRLSPADFEKLRGDYPVRREFPFYEIKLTNGTAGLLKVFGEIGFKI